MVPIENRKSKTNRMAVVGRWMERRFRTGGADVELLFDQSLNPAKHQQKRLFCLTATPKESIKGQSPEGNRNSTFPTTDSTQIKCYTQELALATKGQCEVVTWHPMRLTRQCPAHHERLEASHLANQTW